MFWRKTKSRIRDLRRVSLPGDVGYVSLPAAFRIEMEDDSALMACPPGKETFTLRISSVSAVMKERTEDGGRNMVKKSAAEHGHSYSEMPGAKGVASYEEKSEQNGIPLDVCFWEVGCMNTVVIISATIVRARRDDRIVKASLDAMPAILESLEVTKRHEIIESHGRQVQYISQQAESLPQDIRPFGPEDERWLETCLGEAGRLGLKYTSGGAFKPEELDLVFSRWMAEDGEKESKALVSNALGAAFGAFLVEQHGFSWATVTDEYGTDYAVQHFPGPTMAFPCSSVLKRIERGELEFFQDLYVMLLDQARAAAEEEEHPA